MTIREKWDDGVFRRAIHLAAEVHHLRRLVRQLSDENAGLRRSAAESIEVMEQAKSCLLQARRDAELLALMSRDRPTALAFLRDVHRIDGIDETGEGAA